MIGLHSPKLHVSLMQKIDEQRSKPACQFLGLLPEKETFLAAR